MVLFCHITTRIEGRENDGMLRDVGGTGFPTVAFLDADGTKIGMHSGPRTAAGFDATLSAVHELQAAEKRVAAGDEGAAVDLLIARIELGALGFEEAKAAYGELDELTGEQRSQIEGLLAGLEFSHLQSQRRQLGNEVFQERILEMLAADRVPKGSTSWRFWYSGVMQVAAARKDLELAERAMRNMEKDPFFEGDNSRYLDRFREMIEKMRSDGGN